MTEVLKIFIGFDPRESVAWHTLANSIFRKSSKPVTICPLNLENLNAVYKRPFDSRQSNDFSFSRFLVPYLSEFKGLALYMDCDMLIRTDISELFEYCSKNSDKAVHVVQHDYKTKVSKKYLNNTQQNYPRKNWSSIIMWNCEHPSNREVTSEFVNTADAAQLHRFLWLRDQEIGSLSVEWNWLVDEYVVPSDSVKNLHWTLGGPYFNEYADVDGADEWRAARDLTFYCMQIEDN